MLQIHAPCFNQSFQDYNFCNFVGCVAFIEFVECMLLVRTCCMNVEFMQLGELTVQPGVGAGDQAEPSRSGDDSEPMIEDI